MNKKQILITIPHASTFVPADLRRLMELSDKDIRKQSDLYTDEIFNVPNAEIVKAKISRLVADVNRAPDDIESEYELAKNGVVVSISEEGKRIYKTPPGMKAIMERVEKYHDTFHEEVDHIAPHVKFMIDGHSLWSVGPAVKDDAGKERADVVLGNRSFTTCSRTTTLKIQKFFEEKGLSVKINNPYEGKYVIGYHCSRRTLPGIQIEFNRKLYMNEKTLHPYKDKIKELNGYIKELVDILSETRVKK